MQKPESLADCGKGAASQQSIKRKADTPTDGCIIVKNTRREAPLIFLKRERLNMAKQKLWPCQLDTRREQAEANRRATVGTAERANERAIAWGVWKLMQTGAIAGVPCGDVHARLVNGLPTTPKQRAAYDPQEDCEVEIWKNGKNPVCIASITLPPHARPVADALAFWDSVAADSGACTLEQAKNGTMTGREVMQRNCELQHAMAY